MVEHLAGKLAAQTPGSVAESNPGQDLDDKETSLSIWLPASLNARADALAEHLELTKSDLVRNSLALHSIGRTRFEILTSQGDWKPKRKASQDHLLDYRDGRSILRSPERVFAPEEPEPPKKPAGRRTAFIREHGKSEVAVRVFLPNWLKAGLESLAESARLPISEYCRGELALLI